MTKRTVGLVILVVLFALSATGFAVMPGTAASVEQTTFASLQFDLGWAANPPDCPYPDTCTGGGGG